ncbi:MAG: hypothetical protein H0T17_04925 [Propionibacteriales bacterium]|nr:hypothetical protein [Propionibacteriales bacterium]
MSIALAPVWRVPSPSVLAAREAGVWSRRDACLLFGEPRVRAQLAGRRWQAPLPSVLVTHNGSLTDEQRMWVVLLGAPPGVRLHGLSAAVHDGLRGLEPDGLTIVMPGASRNPARAQLEVPVEWEVRLRWSTMLGPDDVNNDALPPRTRFPRSIVDAASERVPERRSRVIVLAAVQQRRARPAALWDALSRRGRCRNRAIIVESIRDAEGGIESLPERGFELQRRRLGLPEPARQRVMQRGDRRYYLDDEWPDLGIRVEIHGIPHSEVRQWDDDLLRQNDISIQGGLLVFSSYAIRHLQPRVDRQLLDMFRSRGWRG